MEKNNKISLKSSINTIPTAITDNNVTIANPSEIANAFNSCFAKLSIDIQSSIRFSKRKYCDYLLPNLNIKSFLINATDSTEVPSIISSLNQDKNAPSSIPSRILKLLIKGISDQLVFLLNQSFFSGLFLTILKTRKIISI